MCSVVVVFAVYKEAGCCPRPPRTHCCPHSCATLPVHDSASARELEQESADTRGQLNLKRPAMTLSGFSRWPCSREPDEPDERVSANGGRETDLLGACD